MPVRIQRRRVKGWRLPTNARCVTRPGVFGNPFTVAGARAAGYLGDDAQLAGWCVLVFRTWLTKPHCVWWHGPASEDRRAKLLTRLPELRGKDLACYCPPGQPCHADVLLELANTPGLGSS